MDYISKKDVSNKGLIRKNGRILKLSVLELWYKKGYLEYKNSKYSADERLEYGLRLSFDFHIINRANLRSGYIQNTKISERGSCYSFSIDKVNKTIKVPTIPVDNITNYRAYVVCFTGKDSEIDITEEIELNNPFFFGKSEYFNSNPNNISWLKSNGSFYSGSIYVSFYEWLLKIYNNIQVVEGVSVKSNLEDYNDYDYVINTANMTFRLPKLNGEENLPGNTYQSWTLQDSGTEYEIVQNGFLSLNKSSTASGQRINLSVSGGLQTTVQSSTSAPLSIYMPVKRGQIVQVSYTVTGDTNHFRFIPSKGNGTLYFYVGETIQNANLINVGNVFEQLATKTNSVEAAATSMPSNKYIDLTLGATGTKYTAPANGWFVVRKRTAAANQGLFFGISNGAQFENYNPVSGAIIGLAVPAKRGDVLNTSYSAGGTTEMFRFIYAEGDK